jgi:predicted transglutaminase-like cysteine proteinase
MLSAWLMLAGLAHGAEPLRAAARGVAATTPTHPAVQQLWLLLDGLSMQDPPTQLLAIHRFFNRHIRFATDEQAWGQVDYWASPLEALRRGQGDCEDYAIAKYFSLVAVGMPAARLRLVYVRARLDDGPLQAHMVLAYYPPDGGEPLVMDNLNEEILPASRRADLHPVFSFNGEGLWQGVGMVGAGNPVQRLTRWREVMVKARAEGFR